MSSIVYEEIGVAMTVVLLVSSLCTRLQENPFFMTTNVSCDVLLMAGALENGSDKL